MITKEQAIEALKTIKEFCKQTSYDICDGGGGECLIKEFCPINMCDLPAGWQIPQLGGEQHD